MTRLLIMYYRQQSEFAPRRLVLVVVCALHLFGDLYAFDSHELAESLLSLIFTALPGVGAIWLFTRESKQWFEEVSAARARRE